jgi:hypothetical protein
MKLIKTIDDGGAQGDGILLRCVSMTGSTCSNRATKDATVIDSRDGTVLGKIDLGGVPEQSVSDGKGMLYVVMQDSPGGVAAVDVKTMKVVAALSVCRRGAPCNGLAMDRINRVHFAACRAGTPQPMMVILRADDGRNPHHSATSPEPLTGPCSTRPRWRSSARKPTAR